MTNRPMSSIILDHYAGADARAEESAADAHALMEKKDTLRSLLKHGAYIVEFTKVDGTPSVMECTLDARLLPPSDGNSPNPAVDTITTLRVWAIDRQGWRSFRVANVTNYYRKPDVL